MANPAKWIIKDWKLGKFRRAKDSPMVAAAKKVCRDTGRRMVNKLRSKAHKRSGATVTAATAKIMEKNDKITVIVGARTGVKKSLGVFTRGKRKGQEKVAIPARYIHLQQRNYELLTKSQPSAAEIQDHGRRLGAELTSVVGQG